MVKNGGKDYKGVRASKTILVAVIFSNTILISVRH